MRGLSLGVLAILTAASILSAWIVRGLVKEQERGLLEARAAEVSLVLSGLVSNVRARLELIGTVTRVSQASPESFASVAGGAERGVVGAGVLRPGPDGFVAELAAGPALDVGQVVTGPRADAMRRALEVKAVVSTPVMEEGGVTTIGFALGPPSAAEGTVVYRETVLSPGSSGGTGPFSELHGTLYASARPDPTQVVLTTADPGRPVEHPGSLHRPFAAGPAPGCSPSLPGSRWSGRSSGSSPCSWAPSASSCPWPSSPSSRPPPVAATTPWPSSTTGPGSCRTRWRRSRRLARRRWRPPG